jgi:5'(3')-deoxyribonucleotidase
MYHPMVYKSVLGVFFSIVSGVDQKIEAVGIWLVVHYRDQVPFVEHQHFVHCVDKRIQKIPTFCTEKLRRLLLLKTAHS